MSQRTRGDAKTQERMQIINGVQVELSTRFSCAEIMSLKPNQIQAFMQGLAEVLAANEKQKEASHASQEK